MTPCERIKCTLSFKIPDTVGIYDCIWDETQEKWRSQNLLPRQQSHQDFFNYDLRLFEFDQSFLFMEKERQVDAEALIKGWQDFRALLTPCRARISGSFEEEYKPAQDAGLFLTLAFLDPFQHAVSIFGFENLLMLLAENPGFVRDVFSVSAELTIGMCNLLKREGFIFDGAWLWADLAYKNGCYFSPKTYKNLLYPYHKRLCQYFSSKGMPVIYHSDGNFLGLVPLLLKAGVRALNPLEADCGFDLEFMKAEYGRDLVLFGNIQTGVLEKDKRQIEIFLSSRLETAKKGGGFIYHGDKPVPPTVSFENYAFALEMVRKYGSY